MSSEKDNSIHNPHQSILQKPNLNSNQNYQFQSMKKIENSAYPDLQSEQNMSYPPLFLPVKDKYP
jgi:hypothetical protein